MAMPLVRLDTTVADLYRNHGIHGPFIAITQPVFANIDLHPEFPRELIYPEDEEPFLSDESEDEIAKLRATVFDLKPIKRVLPLGNMDVILFTRSIENAKRVLGQLPPEQQPNPCFVDLNQGNVASKLRKLSKGRKLLYWSPQGWMQDHDCLIDTDLSYEMNSKRYLISSGIHTPESEIVDLAVENTPDFVLRSRALPFVVKLPLATSGHGTWLITTEARRYDMLMAINKFIARGGKEVLVSSYVNTKQDLSVHIVIGAKGDERDRDNPLIVAITVQNLTVGGHWTGGRIDYSTQSTLKSLVRDTVRQTSRLLPEGFVGWAGLDIVVDEKGNQWVVDLNPRWTGSVPLCLLSNHFFTQRGLRHAEFGAFPYEGATEDIYDLLSPELRSGQVIINALAKVGKQSNMADLVWGGRDIEDLVNTAESIKLKLSKNAC
jgi:ATP-grasp domain